MMYPKGFSLFYLVLIFPIQAMDHHTPGKDRSSNRMGKPFFFVPLSSHCPYFAKQNEVYFSS